MIAGSAPLRAGITTVPVEVAHLIVALRTRTCLYADVIFVVIISVRSFVVCRRYPAAVNQTDVDVRLTFNDCLAATAFHRRQFGWYRSVCRPTSMQPRFVL